MSNQPPLNPDALDNLATVVFGFDIEEWNEHDEDEKRQLLAPYIRTIETYLAAALPEVTSVEQLKALPIGSVILDGGGDAGIIEPGAILFAETNPLSPEYVAKHYLPARVLYRPGEQP